MYCDSEALARYASEMNTILNSIEEYLATIEASYKKIYNKANWNSEARNHFFDKTAQVFQNMDAISTKCLNSKQYLEVVIANYTNLNNVLSNTFRF